MDPPSLGERLRSLREAQGLNAKEVCERMSGMGYEMSHKTLYGYETGLRMPNADTFLALCSVYQCKDILGTFCDIKIDYSIPDDQEWELIEAYRELDSYGKDVVETLVEKERTRCREQHTETDREHLHRLLDEQLDAEKEARRFRASKSG